MGHIAQPQVMATVHTCNQRDEPKRKKKKNKTITKHDVILNILRGII